ncbi:MAG: VWA domain-containing protein, partial [Tannerella sp.]|jgi:Mg-chelatase subunit ChlD|nr:VWA domain-containing protein [Tannerella sp.]
MMLTFATSPIFIPGVTTKKWEQNSVFNFGTEKKQRDLLLLIDTSGSMGKVADSKSNMHQAVLASYGLIQFFESKQGQVALIGFSDRITADIEWTKNYDEIKEKLLISGSGGTNFPIHRVQNEIEKSKNAIVTVVITDGEIHNIQNLLDFFHDYLNEGNKLYIFLQNRKTQISSTFKQIRDFGAKIVVAITAREMCDEVLNELE